MKHPALGPSPRLLPVLRALLATQFLGALNDNLYKMVVSMLAIQQALQGGAGGGMLALVSAVFIAPFLLFAGYAGHTADVYSKRQVVMVSKIAEVVIMGLAWAAFALGRLEAMLVVLFLLATQATFFGPAKYGLLPELVAPRDLVQANGLLEMSTFLAILLGSALGSGMFVLWQTHLEIVGLILCLFALAGLWTSSWIPEGAPPSRSVPWPRNPWGDIVHGITRLYSERVLWLTVLGVAFFWLVAALLHMTVLIFGKEVMGLDDLRVGLLGTCLALGIGLGSLVAGRLSSQKVELGLVPLGAIGLGVCTLALSSVTSSYLAAATALLLLGLCGGWFIVPLQAFLQQKSPAAERGMLLATTNFLSMAAVLGASGLFWLGRGPAQLAADRLLLLLGLGIVGGTFYVLRLLPAFLVRLVCWLLTHSLYRIRILGEAYIPRSGPALLVCNHVSYVDGLLINACVPRFVRFLIYRPIYEITALRWLFRLMQAIPIAGGPGAPAALAQARQALRQGHVVCIFAEGSISRTGNLLPFKRGFERIVEGLQVPVIPVHLDRLWGSMFSFQGGRFLWKWPRQVPYSVTVSFGAPLAAPATAPQVRQVIMELGSAAMMYRHQRQESLGYRVWRTARRQWSTFCMADAQQDDLTYGQMLVRSLLVARWLHRQTPPGARLGIYLPPSVLAALANVGSVLAGRVPVNLPPHASAAALQTTLQQAEIALLLTSRHIWEQAALPLSTQVLDIEAMLAQPARLRHVCLALLLRWLPARLLYRAWRTEDVATENLATVVFTRGSNGSPSGVMLSHRHILANSEGLDQVFALQAQDRILGVLSLYHALGCTVTLWLPLLTGCGVVYHDTALDTATVATLAQRYRVTLLAATPTLYEAYVDACPAAAFATLRYALSGAAPLPDSLVAAFRSRYGLEILQGYGCAEMAAVVSVNLRDVQYGRHRQTGAKPGSVGHPVPGVAVKVVAPASGEPLPPNTPGLLLVRGPYPMLGYLGQPQRTAAVLHQGWYRTDDLASVDEDGFIYWHGRLPGSDTPARA
ncbi:MAG: MFS transporter [Candidatus Tectimicrobiota bacterium]